MRWILLDTVISPETGTSFSRLSTARNNQLIVWHAYNRHICPGKDVIYRSGKVWVKGTGKIHIIKVLKSDIYSHDAWQNLKKYCGCDKYLKGEGCSYIHYCVISRCPLEYR